MLLPFRTKMPTPFLIKDPRPLIVALKIEVVPVSAKNVPPPTFSVIALLEVIPSPAASASSVPPLKLERPCPQVCVAVHREDPAIEGCSAGVGIGSRERQRSRADLD